MSFKLVQKPCQHQPTFDANLCYSTTRIPRQDMKEIQNFQTSNYRTKVHDPIFVACFISKPNIKKLSQLPTPYSVTQRLVDIVRIKYVCLRHASPHITGINATTSFSAASSKPKTTLRRNSKENSHNKHHLSRAETSSCTDRI